MAINFPDNPTIGDTYTSGQRTWRWDGVSWNAYGIVPDPTVLRIDSVNGRVGVNNSSPTTALDVDGDINLSGSITVGGSYVGLSSDAITDADGDTKIQVEESADEDTIRFDIAGAEKMTLDSSSLTVSDSVSADHFAASGTGANLIPSGTTAERPVSPTAGMIRFNETTGEPEWYSSAMSDWVKFRNGPTFTVSYLVIAGGGGGGNDKGAGGGGGGYVSSWNNESSGGGNGAESILTLSTVTNYTVTVGAGGGNGVPGSDGNNSVFASVTSIGGGGGACDGSRNGRPGGSGGGASRTGTVGSGTVNQGYAGGLGREGPVYAGGGGGGAGQVGQAAPSDRGGDGGDGVYSTITGSSVGRAGGGAGGSYLGGSGTASEGGGNGGTNAGTANTGGGGGGGNNQQAGGSGGSGIVVARYSSDRTIVIGAGLTSTTTTVGSDKITVFTAGTGTVSWS